MEQAQKKYLFILTLTKNITKLVRESQETTIGQNIWKVKKGQNF